MACVCAGTAVGAAVLECWPASPWTGAAWGLALGGAACLPAAWGEWRGRCLAGVLPAVAGAAGPLGLALAAAAATAVAAWWGGQAPSPSERLLERHRQRLLRYPLLLAACPGLGAARDVEQVAAALVAAGARVLGEAGSVRVHRRRADGRWQSTAPLSDSDETQLAAAWEAGRGLRPVPGRLLVAVRPTLARTGLPAPGAGEGLVLEARWHADGPDELQRELLEILGRLGAMALGSTLLLQQTRLMAVQDAVTGLLGGYELRRRLDELSSQARRQGSSLGLLWCDLDHLKHFNDTWGHAVGDGALRVLARALRENVGGEGILGRMGGEEFAVLLPGADAERCRNRAEAVRAAVAAGVVDPAHPTARVTVSIGWSLLRGDDADAETALARADAACYRAKSAGRDRVEGAP